MSIVSSEGRKRWKTLGEGLVNGLAPMLGKEMRSRTRGLRYPLLLTFYLGLLSAGTVVFLWIYLDQSSQIHPRVGLSFYGLLVVGLVLLLSFIAPALAAGAISGERERRTYDLLLATRASLTGIVLGKWLASVAYLLFLVLAALPLLAVVYLFGGVPPSALAKAVLICLLTGLGYGALGICLSALIRRSQAATIVSLVLVFFLVFGTLVAAGIMADRDRRDAGPEYRPAGIPWYVFASPLAATAEVLPGAAGIAPGGGAPLINLVMNELMRQFQPRMTREYAMKMAYTRGYGQPPAESPEKTGGIAAWPVLARFALNQVLLAAISLAVAALAITPLKPWQARRARKTSYTDEIFLSESRSQNPESRM